LSCQGGALNTYWAGGVNYILWGHMWRYFHDNYWYSGATLTEAISLVYAYKGVNYFNFGWDQSQINTAVEFTKYGYNGTDPSSVALPFVSNPHNVVKAAMLQPWEFHSLHSN
jgi:hypothetical protein